MPLCEGSQNIESAKLVVVRGTPTTGTPTDPAVNTTSPLDGGTTYDMPLYRIPLDGITIGAPVALFNVLKPMSDVWDSLTQRSTTWRVPYSNNSISLTRVGDICFAGGNVKFNQNGENNYTQRGRPYPWGIVQRKRRTFPSPCSAATPRSSSTASIRAVWSCSAIRTARTRDAPAYGGPPTRCPPHSFGTLAQAVALSCSDPTGHSAYETVMPNAFVPCVPP